MSFLWIERVANIGVLRLDDPARRNVLSQAICLEISAAVASINADPDARGIILTGAGSAFCAGADLSDLLAAADGDTAAVHAVYQSFMDVANSALPTLAAVNGPAIGAGFNLALACDRRIAATSARFETRFLKIGLHPGGGHAWMLLRAIGWAQANRLLLCGGPVDGAEAHRIGLAEACVAPDELLTAAHAAMAPLEHVPRDLLLRTKQSLRHATTATHADAFARETEEQAWSLAQPAFTELATSLRTKLGTATPDKG